MNMTQGSLLESYWLTLPGIPENIGISAYSIEDATSLLHEHGYELDLSSPDIDIKTGITHSDLDQNHIVPNMGPIAIRGIWYPAHNI